MNIDAYIQFRRERLKRISVEVKKFTWHNFVLAMFCFLVLVKHIGAPDLNCEFAFAVMIINSVL